MLSKSCRYYKQLVLSILLLSASVAFGGGSSDEAENRTPQVNQVILFVDLFGNNPIRELAKRERRNLEERLLQNFPRS